MVKKMATKKTHVLVPDHIYVPKHEIMNKKDAEKVLQKFNCKIGRAHV